jgi:hypothetical protein
MYYVGVVVMKISTFWDTTPCHPLKANRRFGRTRRLHLQGRRISHVRNLHERVASRTLLPWLILRPCRWRQHIPLKRPLICNGLNGVISQKIELLVMYCSAVKMALNFGCYCSPVKVIFVKNSLHQYQITHVTKCIK